MVLRRVLCCMQGVSCPIGEYPVGVVQVQMHVPFCDAVSHVQVGSWVNWGIVRSSRLIASEIGGFKILSSVSRLLQDTPGSAQSG